MRAARPSILSPTATRAAQGSRELSPVGCYSRPVTSPARLLVVDDDPGIREMLSLVLGQAGHLVTTSDGRAPFEPGDAEVILLDLRLGDRTAAELLVDAPDLADRTVVLVTAVGEEGADLDRLPLAPAAVLRKPFDLATLRRAVATAVAIARRQPSATSSRPWTGRT